MRWWPFAAGATLVSVLVAAPLVGWPPVLRLPAVLAVALLVAIVGARPWRWSVEEWKRIDLTVPSTATLAWCALAAGLVIFWIVLTRFQSGEINAVDFTVYFDRPCFQTIQHRPLFVETADVPSFSWRSELTVHAFWAMLAVAQLYRLHATPYWLLALAVVSVAAGATHVLRIVRHLTGSTILGISASLAFLLNDNTARALNYGFHPEILYMWFVPWMIDAGLRRAARSFVMAVLATVLVKEDACMALFAGSVVLAVAHYHDFTARERLLFLVFPSVMGLASLAFYYWHVLAVLAPDGIPTYASFWGNYGATPIAALGGMIRHPIRVLVEAATSGFFPSVMLPFLFLPLVGWRWKHQASYRSVLLYVRRRMNSCALSVSTTRRCWCPSLLSQLRLGREPCPSASWVRGQEAEPQAAHCWLQARFSSARAMPGTVCGPGGQRLRVCRGLWPCCRRSR